MEGGEIGWSVRPSNRLTLSYCMRQIHAVGACRSQLFPMDRSPFTGHHTRATGWTPTSILAVHGCSDTLQDYGSVDQPVKLTLVTIQVQRNSREPSQERSSIWSVDLSQT